jgi:GrpB-like predicted nucleotidyltransferase (UPF0157 family)
VEGSDRDAYLEEVLIGGREKRPIVLVEYDPSWPLRFEGERDRIAQALGALGVRIEHIGSTSVPGLAAKPVVDILVTVANVEDESAFLVPLQQAGYELRVREPGHRMLRTRERDVHIHIWTDSDPEVGRHMRFRERLRSSPEARDAYERLKRELATREWSDVNEYADAKGQLIESILAEVPG